MYIIISNYYNTIVYNKGSWCRKATFQLLCRRLRGHSACLIEDGFHLELTILAVIISENLTPKDKKKKKIIT